MKVSISLFTSIPSRTLPTSRFFTLHSSLFTSIAFRFSLKKWLVAMEAAWISPDVVNNVILVLIGEQGAYKTTWFNYLLPPQLKHYFYTKTNANRMSKDDLLTLTQYALVCCEELDTMRPAELNQLKATVTMTSIDERAAYAYYHEHRKHIASFCGTGNNPQFLSDPTGNRRWLPFEVASIVSPTRPSVPIRRHLQSGPCPLQERLPVLVYERRDHAAEQSQPQV